MSSRCHLPRSYSMRGQMTDLASSSLPLSMRMLPHLAMAMARSAGPSVWGRHQPPVYGSWTRGIGTRAHVARAPYLVVNGELRLYPD